ncbi:MAG: ABC transporter substrate-binding protein [Fibrobacteres bacterium]|nr:ABC transporter substrate-binding protein [Fibrobacterota bacterium]
MNRLRQSTPPSPFETRLRRSSGRTARFLSIQNMLALSGLVLSVGCGNPPAPARTDLPRRIVSVTITGDVVLQALVDSSRVLAVSALADDSGIHEAAGLFPAKPRVGPDLERIVSMRPDLVLLGSFHDPAFLHAIRQSGLPVEVLESPRSFEDVRGFLRRVSGRLGSGASGDSLVGWMDSTLNAAREKTRGCPGKPRVLYWSDGYTAGDSSTVGEMLEWIGAKNAAAELGLTGSKPISVEDALRLAPDWVLRSGWEGMGGMKAFPQALQDLPAVRDGRVVVVPGKWLLSTSHRMAFGADSLARSLAGACKGR